MAYHPGKFASGHQTTKQKGGNTRRKKGGIGTYAAKQKRRNADRYTRPYLTGEYRQWPNHKQEETQQSS